MKTLLGLILSTVLGGQTPSSIIVLGTKVLRLESRIKFVLLIHSILIVSLKLESIWLLKSRRARLRKAKINFILDWLLEVNLLLELIIIVIAVILGIKLGYVGLSKWRSLLVIRSIKRVCNYWRIEFKRLLLRYLCLLYLILTVSKIKSRLLSIRILIFLYFQKLLIRSQPILISRRTSACLRSVEVRCFLIIIYIITIDAHFLGSVSNDLAHVVRRVLILELGSLVLFENLGFGFLNQWNCCVHSIDIRVVST